MKVSLPSIEFVSELISSDDESPCRERILTIAKRLESLDEYNPEQALMVAADLVMHEQINKES